MEVGNRSDDALVRKCAQTSKREHHFRIASKAAAIKVDRDVTHGERSGLDVARNHAIAGCALPGRKCRIVARVRADGDDLVVLDWQTD